MYFRIFLAFSLVIFLNSCIKKKEATYLPTEKTDPYKIYEEGLTAFKENDFLFTNNGGDVQTLINSCMMAHSKRVFGASRGYKQQLIPADIQKGFEIYKKNKTFQHKADNQPNAHMYL